MLRNFVNPEAININLQSEDKEEVFEEMTEALIAQNASLNRAEVLESLLIREKKMTTGVGNGIAIPHAISDKIDRPVCAIGISRKGIDYEAIDNKPVTIIFMILFPSNDTSLHLNIMQRLAIVFSNPNFYKSVIEQTSGAHVAQAIFAIEENL